MAALAPDFYDRDVVEVAPELIGCTVTYDGASGVIVETEAYHEREPACHAFAGLTPRTATLFGRPGHAYVYRSYGVHALLNAVCEHEGVGAAVLIRALQPLSGVAEMEARRRRNGRPGLRADGRVREHDLCSGPGKLTQALGIWLTDNGTSLSRGRVRVGPRPRAWRDPSIVVGTRVGITHAVELPWRFCAAGNRHVSSPRPTVGLGDSAAGAAARG
jgi:DNA-3-methyladenine glycosylase